MDKLDYNGKLNAYETNITKELVKILTPFQWATDMVQGQNKVTASVVMPVIHGLQIGMEELSSKHSSKMVLSHNNSVYSRLAKYETNTFKIAISFDPRWKLDWFTTTKKDIKKTELLPTLAPPKHR